MNARALALFLAILSVATNGLGPESSLPQPYTDKDAYQIYALLIPNEEIGCTKTVVIQQETVRGADPLMNIDSCVEPSVAHDFQKAIANFKAANRSRWLLQHQFEIERPQLRPD